MQKWMEEIINQPVEKLVERMEAFNEDNVDEPLLKSMALKSHHNFGVLEKIVLPIAGVLGALAFVFVGLDLLQLFVCMACGAMVTCGIGVVASSERVDTQLVYNETKKDAKEFKVAGGLKKLKEALKLYKAKHGVSFAREISAIYEKETENRKKEERERLRALRQKRLEVKREITQVEKDYRQVKRGLKQERERALGQAKTEAFAERPVDREQTQQIRKTYEVETRLENSLIKTIRDKKKKELKAKRNVIEITYNSQSCYVDVKSGKVYEDEACKKLSEDLMFDGQEIYVVETQTVKND